METHRPENKTHRQPFVNVGDRIFIDPIEWTVAEINPDKIILYREGIDGGSRTMELTLDELKSAMEP